MSKTIKYLALLLLILGAFLGGLWMSKQWSSKPRIEEDGSVIIEQIDKVCKLVTVEGTFSGIYSQKNTKDFLIYFPMTKKAQIQVTGKVMAGYDMEKIQIDVDNQTKIITLSNLPEAKIIAIDHDVKYHNIEESFFNEFTAKDFTMWNKGAKDLLQKQAIDNALLKQAEQQGNQMLETIEFMAKIAGYKVEIQGYLPTESSPNSIFDEDLN